MSSIRYCKQQQQQQLLLVDESLSTGAVPDVRCPETIPVPSVGCEVETIAAPSLCGVAILRCGITAGASSLSITSCDWCGGTGGGVFSETLDSGLESPDCTGC